MVRERGLEPPRFLGHKILSLARLPVPPLPHGGRSLRVDARLDSQNNTFCKRATASDCCPAQGEFGCKYGIGARCAVYWQYAGTIAIVIYRCEHKRARRRSRRGCVSRNAGREYDPGFSLRREQEFGFDGKHAIRSSRGRGIAFGCRARPGASCTRDRGGGDRRPAGRHGGET